jgi:hypothetical protein
MTIPFVLFTLSLQFLGIVGLPQSQSSRSIIPRRTDDINNATTFTRKIQKLNARDIVFQGTLGSQGLPFFKDLEFSAPCSSKKQKVLIDTGSSDFWIDAGTWCGCDDTDPKITTTGEKLCNQIDAKEGKKQVSTLKYNDNSWVRGPFVNQDFRFGPSVLPQAKFLAATDRGKDTIGITGMVGLGYVANQQIESAQSALSSIPHLLFESKKTKSIAYSMWWSNSAQTSQKSPAKYLEGQIMFGGYMENYFEGQLSAYKIINISPTTANPKEIVITWSDMWYKASTKTAKAQRIFKSCDQFYYALLDTGTFKTRLPQEVFKQLGALLDVRVYFNGVTEPKTALVSCEDVDMDAKIAFQFGTKSIWVPIKSFVRKVDAADKTSIKSDKFRDGDCIIHGKHSSFVVTLICLRS